MLDTNMCIFLMKNRPEVVSKYTQNNAFGIAISTITIAELQFGISKSAFPEKNRDNLAAFLIGVAVCDFDDSAAIEYGRIRATLQNLGTPIGSLDTLIAAHAKSRDMVLVTNNTSEFSRVDGLELEDWL